MNTNMRALFVTLAIAVQAACRQVRRSSVVASFSVYVAIRPDLTVPWQTEGIDSFGGSGVIIEGGAS